MDSIPRAVQNLINELSKLPGIGPRQAGRLTFHLLKGKKEKIEALAKAVEGLNREVVFCSVCFNLTDNVDENICKICSNKRRDQHTICVVEEPFDVLAIEKSKSYYGTYHILGGVISPLEGINPEDLRIKELLQRAKNNNIKEIILATNPNTEGEATALYLARILRPFDIKTSRIARGLPFGADLEYADEITLTQAFENRKDYGKNNSKIKNQKSK